MTKDPPPKRCILVSIIVLADIGMSFLPDIEM